ncbi:MAG TPA: FUSC family protein [Stellaceae bacterium]|nr:FUSC family protein [Stellaceae bacterium]
MPTITDWASRHRVELRLSLRMSAAGLVTFAVGSVLGLSQIYWAVLTAVIVMQASIGGSLKASLDRFVGTIGGAAWGVAVAVSVPHQGAVSTGAALGLTLVPLSVLAAFRPGYRVATATGAIVLLGRFGQIGVVEAALDRVFEIGLGSVVALAVALVVTPARAHGLLGGAARDALDRMAELAAMLLGELAAPADTSIAIGFHDRIRAAIERAAIAADEAARERRSLVTEAPDPMPLVRCLRRLSHDFVIVARARSAALAPAAAERLAGPAGEMAAALSAYLSAVGAALVSGTLPPAPVDTAFDAFQQAMADLRRDGTTRALSGEEVERVFGLSFALDQIRSNLEDLAGHARDLVKPPRRR